MTGRAAPALALTLVLGLLAGCGVRPSDVITGGPAPHGPRGWLRVYLLSNGAPAPVLRAGDQHSTPTQVLDHLVAGPATDERARGYTTEVPIDLEPVAVTVDPAAGTATVSLAGDPATLSAAAVDQIVCTTVDAVAADQPARARFTVTLTGQGHSRGPQSCPVRR